MKTKFLMLALILSLVIVSCSKDREENNVPAITPNEAKSNANIDMANDDVMDIAAEQEANTYADNVNGKMADVASSAFAACATITRVPAYGTAITPGTTVIKTIDFGTTGCTLPNGNVLKGKIIIEFVYDPNATTHTIEYTLDHFFHNNIEFNGSKTFTRTMTTATPSSPSHPIVTMNMSYTATFPNGGTLTRTGQRVREIIQGYATPSWTDNVYQVTGSWTTSFPNSSIQNSTITSALIVKMSCAAEHKPLLVQGVIAFQRNNHIATLDYGTGACDNLAVLTVNGVSYDIIIGL
jgi:hypothetical protein